VLLLLVVLWPWSAQLPRYQLDTPTAYAGAAAVNTPKITAAPAMAAVIPRLFPLMEVPSSSYGESLNALALKAHYAW
jgi:hypothetical protein